MADFFEDSEKFAEEEDDIITLFNEETGKEEEFYHIATLDVDDRWFIVMKPAEELPDFEEDEVLIYEIVADEDGNDMFAPIEDEELLNKVFKEFENELKRFAEENGIDA